MPAPEDPLEGNGVNGSAIETLQQQTDALTGEDVASDASTATGRDMAVGDAG